ncbi:MAG: ATP-binding cassette domain-containing protein [Ferruginibacter sp.]
MLNIINFRKKYAGSTEPVLLISDCKLDKGIYWIKGENGSGKTSLLKSIAGLIPFEGDIVVDGLDINNNRMAYAKIVNYAESEPKYPPFLTGKELIGFYKTTKRGHFPDALLKGLGVEKFMYQKTATYSSGMLKKLSLVLAFTGNPVLVLLDEPLVALDIAAVDTLHSTIRQYSQTGVSFLITSHQLLSGTLIDNAKNLLLRDKTLRIEKV